MPHSGSQYGFLGTIIFHEDKLVSMDQKLKDHLSKLNIKYRFFISENNFPAIKKLLEEESLLYIHESKIHVDACTFSCIFVFDATLQQELVKELQRVNEDRSTWREVFNGSIDGICMFDEKGIAIFVNRAFTKLTDIPVSDIVGRNISELRKEKVLPSNFFADTIGSTSTFSFLAVFNNQKKYVVTSYPVFSENTEPKMYVGLIHDVSLLSDLVGQLEDHRSIQHEFLGHAISGVPSSFQGTKDTVLNPTMVKIYQDIKEFANVDSTILLTGETGVGKDYIATYIHQISSFRNGNIVKVNCGAIPEHLLESELFGYEEGAFTGAKKGGKKGLFEYANNGTLFLDEIGETPYLLQVKLLSALNDKCFYRVGSLVPIQFTARVIAATNADLNELIKEKKFRADLYYRINIITFEIPPLRERPEEILPIAKKLLKEYYSRYNKFCTFSPAVLEAFLRYDWPGNIREMKNTIERMVLLCKTDCIDIELLPSHILLHQNEDAPNLPLLDFDLSLERRVENYEAQIIETTIRNSNSLKEAASKLNISLSTLVRKKSKYGI